MGQIFVSALEQQVHGKTCWWDLWACHTRSLEPTLHMLLFAFSKQYHRESPFSSLPKLCPSPNQARNLLLRTVILISTT